MNMGPLNYRSSAVPGSFENAEQNASAHFECSRYFQKNTSNRIPYFDNIFYKRLIEYHNQSYNK